MIDLVRFSYEDVLVQIRGRSSWWLSDEIIRNEKLVIKPRFLRQRHHSLSIPPSGPEASLLDFWCDPAWPVMMGCTSMVSGVSSSIKHWFSALTTGRRCQPWTATAPNQKHQGTGPPLCPGFNVSSNKDNYAFKDANSDGCYWGKYIGCRF